MRVKLVRPYGTYAGSGFRATYTVEDSGILTREIVSKLLK